MAKLEYVLSLALNDRQMELVRLLNKLFLYRRTAMTAESYQYLLRWAQEAAELSGIPFSIDEDFDGLVSHKVQRAVFASACLAEKWRHEHGDEPDPFARPVE
jgi:hypothetical protein